jgi:hypothetical protein
MRPLIRFAVVLGLALLVSPAMARVDEPIAGCIRDRLLGGRTDGLGLAKVVSPRARFQWLPKACAVANPECMARQYVVKGDLVVTGGTWGDFTCAYYPNKAGGGAGWLSTAQLQAVPSAPTGGGWIGVWGETRWLRLTLTAAGADIVVKGEAYWQGMHPGNIHTGEIDGRGRPVGDALEVGDYDGCRVRLRRLGPYLLVADNNGCGGMNVRFADVYRRGR